MSKKAKVWVIAIIGLLLAIGGSFLIIARSAIFGDASWSEVDLTAWIFINIVSVGGVAFVISSLWWGNKKDSDKK